MAFLLRLERVSKLKERFKSLTTVSRSSLISGLLGCFSTDRIVLSIEWVGLTREVVVRGC